VKSKPIMPRQVAALDPEMASRGDGRKRKTAGEAVITEAGFQIAAHHVT